MAPQNQSSQCEIAINPKQKPVRPSVLVINKKIDQVITIGQDDLGYHNIFIIHFSDWAVNHREIRLHQRAQRLVIVWTVFLQHCQAIIRGGLHPPVLIRLVLTQLLSSAKMICSSRILRRVISATDVCEVPGGQACSGDLDRYKPSVYYSFPETISASSCQTADG